MAFNVGGFLNTVGAAGGYLPQAEQNWLAVQARQKAMADAQQQDAARKAFFQSLTTPDAAALPQQGPQGGGMAMPVPQASAGAAPEPPAGLSPQAQSMFSSFGGGASPQPAPASPGPAPAAAGGAATGPVGNGAQFPQIHDPTTRLRQMAMALKRANPGADPLTLSKALEQQVNMMRGLAPDDRAQLQAETQIMRIQAQSDMAVQRAQNQTEIAEIRANTAQQIAQIRDATTQRGQDVRANTATQNRVGAMERTKLVQDRIDQRAAQAAGSRADAKQKADQYKKIMAQRAQIKDAIAANSGVATPEQSTQLQQLDQQAVQFWSANNWLPRPSELDRASPDEAAGGPPSAPAAATPAPAATPPGAGGGGSAAPTVGTVQDGYLFKGGDPSDQTNWEKVQ